MGGTTITIAHPSTRRLCCNREEVWSSYTVCLENHCRHHRLESKINYIANDQNRTMSGTKTAMEAIDAAITDGMKNPNENVGSYGPEKYLSAGC